MMEMMEYLENEKVRMEMMMKMNEIQDGITDLDLRLAKPGRGLLKIGLGKDSARGRGMTNESQFFFDKFDE
jgi:hypothetical protein